MIKAIVTDFSRVLLFPNDDEYDGGLNPLNQKLLEEDPDYNLFEHFNLNHQLLDYYSDLPVPVYVFTSETIQDHRDVTDILDLKIDGVFSAQKMEIHKSEASAYQKIVDEVKFKPEEILYIDDKQSNLDAAAEVGLQTILFTDTDALIDELTTHLD